MHSDLGKFLFQNGYVNIPNNKIAILKTLKLIIEKNSKDFNYLNMVYNNANAKISNEYYQFQCNIIEKNIDLFNNYIDEIINSYYDINKKSKGK